MIDKGIVQGSEAQAKPLVVGLDTVYVHSDIHQIESEDGAVLFEYHEVQYTKDEYFDILAKQAEATDIRVDKAEEDIAMNGETLGFVMEETLPNMENIAMLNADAIEYILTKLLPLLEG